MKSRFRTDLACEREGDAHRSEYLLHGCRVCELTERKKGECTRYATVHVTQLAPLPTEQDAVRAVSEILLCTASRLVASPRCVLVACLGNPRITPDSLGPCTAKALEITRHVQLLNPAAFSHFDKGALCAVVPGGTGARGCARGACGIGDRCGCAGSRQPRSSRYSGTDLRPRSPPRGRGWQPTYGCGCAQRGLPGDIGRHPHRDR